MTEVLIIGGSDAGISAALRARVRPGQRCDGRGGRRLPELQHLRPPLLPQWRDRRLATTSRTAKLTTSKPTASGCASTIVR